MISQHHHCRQVLRKKYQKTLTTFQATNWHRLLVCWSSWNPWKVIQCQSKPPAKQWHMYYWINNIVKDHTHDFNCKSRLWWSFNFVNFLQFYCDHYLHTSNKKLQLHPSPNRLWILQKVVILINLNFQKRKSHACKRWSVKQRENIHDLEKQKLCKIWTA